MKKFLLTSLALVASSVSLGAQALPLTFEQAQKLCPSPDSLQYTAAAPEFGMVTGVQNGMKFYSGLNPDASRPINISRTEKSGKVGNAKWRFPYGSLSGRDNQIITCLYNYPMVQGYSYGLILMNQPTQ